MRPIKFRCWDKEKKEMRYDGFCLVPTSPTWGAVDYRDESEKLGFDLSVFDWSSARLIGGELIPMQWTGLTDRNGKEIYEGDILSIPNGLDDYWYVVEWIYAGFQLVTYKKPWAEVREISHGVNQGYFEFNGDCELIGNIHQHPELTQQEA